MISEEVLALESDIIAWRRHMHQNPELSFQEVHTTAYLTEELKKIPGLTLEFPTKTGVVAVLKGVQPGSDDGNSSNHLLSDTATGTALQII